MPKGSKLNNNNLAQSEFVEVKSKVSDILLSINYEIYTIYYITIFYFIYITILKLIPSNSISF